VHDGLPAAESRRDGLASGLSAGQRDWQLTSHRQVTGRLWTAPEAFSWVSQDAVRLEYKQERGVSLTLCSVHGPEIPRGSHIETRVDRDAQYCPSP
jgi:hypothetical protein